jgi:protein-tyrosine phosphatase
MRVLTVCLGNICRSPTAEAAIRHAADELGVALDVDSAGTGDWHIGELPDARMRAAAKAAGLELTGRARQVEASDLRDFQLVLAMDRDNLRVLESMCDGDLNPSQVKLFRHWDPAGTDLDMPDPYYGGAAGFDDVVEICRRTARALVEELVSR